MPLRFEPTERPPTRTSASFSVTSIFVLTAVFAAVAASLAHLWRAAQGDYDEIGWFVIVTAMSPLVLLVLASLMFQIFRQLGKWINP
jgi:uncharacterized membrane protein YhdT